MLGPAFGRTDFSRIFFFEPPDFFADFLAGFFLLIFVLIFVGKSAQKNPPGKSPAKSSKIYTVYYTTKILQHISADFPGQHMNSLRGKPLRPDSKSDLIASWNLGAWQTHQDDVVAYLVEARPMLLCLQEMRIQKYQLAGTYAILREIGYGIHIGEPACLARNKRGHWRPAGVMPGVAVIRRLDVAVHPLPPATQPAKELYIRAISDEVSAHGDLPGLLAGDWSGVPQDCLLGQLAQAQG